MGIGPNPLSQRPEAFLKTVVFVDGTNLFCQLHHLRLKFLSSRKSGNVISAHHVGLGRAEKGGVCFHTFFAAGPAGVMPLFLLCQMAADRGDHLALRG